MNKSHIAVFVCALFPITTFADTTPLPIPPLSTPTTAVTDKPQDINCEMSFPKDMQSIDVMMIENWASKAVVQAFTLDHTAIDSQLTQLKPCFTEQGWQGFNDALTKSGNLQTIKTNQLSVNSKPQSKPVVILTKPNEWKVTFPLQVEYANKEQKIDQVLTIDLLINRKASGGLGIVQLIATPANKTNPNQTTTPP